MEDSTSADIPLGLPQIVQSLLSYVVPGSKILLCPMRDGYNLGNYNYAILDLADLYSQYTTNFLTAAESNAVFGTSPPKLFVVSFPAVEKDNILMHSVFGHEVGHQVAAKYISNENTSDVTSKISDAIQEEKKNNKVLQNEIDAKDPLFKAQFLQGLIDEIYDLRNGLLHELLSDLAAVHFLGPASLISMVEFASAESLDQVPENDDAHPPWRLRFREAYGEAEHLGYNDKIRSISGDACVTKAKEATTQLLSDVKGLIADQSDLENLKKKYVHKIALTLLQDALPTARTSIRNQLSSIAYPSALLDRECPELLMRLAIGVPPNEILQDDKFVRADFRSAINAGWFYKLSGMTLPDEAGKTADLDAFSRLNRLLRKAIELATLQMEFVENTTPKK